MSHHHSTHVPRGILLAAGALIAVTIGFTALGRYGDIGVVRPAETDHAEVRALHFVDRSDGAVLVVAADRDELVDSLAPGTNGFMRGVLRSLVRARNQAGIGPEAPFHLIRWENGRVSIEDRETGTRVDLDAFGHTNVQAFASLLNDDGDSRQ